MALFILESVTSVLTPTGTLSPSRNYLVKEYFRRGYKYKEILHVLLLLHGIQLSVRQLHRILRKHNLLRRNYSSPFNSVIDFIRTNLLGSGASIGYRQMHQRCILNGLSVTRKNVATVVKTLDPEGVEFRQKRRLRRRMYYSNGPNWVWHIDGYDKLKPYGFPIHGAVDGFSRRILWLKVINSNKDPKVICFEYLKYLSSLAGVPRKIVGDRGTENVYVAAAQRFLRRNHGDLYAGTTSFKYGKSISNQRIEAFWSQLRRSCSGWWMNFFKDMIDTGDLDTTNIIQKECITFVFSGLLQLELDKFREMWNTHLIRKTQYSDPIVRPSGRPDILYFTPEYSHPSLSDCKLSFNQIDLNIVTTTIIGQNTTHGNYICSDEIFELASILMSENKYEMPSDPQEGLVLYRNLLTLISRL